MENDIKQHETAQGICYLESGDKAAKACLLLIHGAGGSSLKWEGQAKGLQGSMRLIMPDLPGHGKTPGPGHSRIADYAADVRHFLAELDIAGPLFIGGHSMGAAISLQMAIDDPDQYAGLVLAGAGARMRTAPDFLQALGRGETNAEFLKFGFNQGFDPVKLEAEILSFASVPAALLFGDFTACDQFDVRSELSSITAPALIITGQQDMLAPVRHAEYLAQNINRAELHLVPDCGHFAMLEQPIRFNQLVDDFVKRCLEGIK